MGLQTVRRVALRANPGARKRRLVTRQPPLLSFLNTVPDRCHVLSCRVVARVHLVKRIVGVFLKLLPYLVNLLVAPQALLILHLVQPALLVRGIRGLEAALRVPIQLVLVGGCEIERVERVVDTCRVERGRLVEGAKSAVDAAAGGLLFGFLCACALGLGRQGGFFLGEKRSLFGLFARGFCGFVGGSVAVVRLVHRVASDVNRRLLQCFDVRLGI